MIKLREMFNFEQMKVYSNPYAASFVKEEGELGKLGKEQHLGWLNRQHKKYEDEIKKKIKALNGKGEKKMAIELMKLYKKHLIEFKIGLEKIYKND